MVDADGLVHCGLCVVSNAFACVSVPCNDHVRSMCMFVCVFFPPLLMGVAALADLVGGIAESTAGYQHDQLVSVASALRSLEAQALTVTDISSAPLRGLMEVRMFCGLPACGVSMSGEIALLLVD